MCDADSVALQNQDYVEFVWGTSNMHTKDKESIGRSFFRALAYVLFSREKSLLFCTVFVAGSYAVEYEAQVPNFFSCSGAVVTIAGLFLNIKYSMNFHLRISKVSLFNKLAGAGVWGTGKISDEQVRYVDGVLADDMYGVSFMIIGTLIWAYGSYLIAAFK